MERRAVDTDYLVLLSFSLDFNFYCTITDFYSMDISNSWKDKEILISASNGCWTLAFYQQVFYNILERPQQIILSSLFLYQACLLCQF